MVMKTLVPSLSFPVDGLAFCWSLPLTVLGSGFLVGLCEYGTFLLQEIQV